MTQKIVALVVTINLRLNSLNLVTDYKRYTQIYDLPFYGLFSCKKNVHSDVCHLIVYIKEFHLPDATPHSINVMTYYRT